MMEKIVVDNLEAGLASNSSPPPPMPPSVEQREHLCIRMMRKKWACALLWLVLGMQGLELVTTFITRIDESILNNVTATLLQNTGTTQNHGKE